MNCNLINLLTICRKAGMLVFGFDAAAEAAASKKSHLILVTSDISAKTLKELLYYTGKTGVPVINIDYTMDDIRKLFKKRIAVLSVNDQGFAKRVSEIMKED